MGIPAWGKEVLKRQDEHTARLDEHTSKLDEHTAKLDEHTAKLDEHTAKLDKLTVTVERHDVFHADLMVFLNQQFAETRRTILEDVKRYLDIVVEDMRSDNRAFREQQRADGNVLKDHAGRIGQLEETQNVAKVSLRGLQARVGALESGQESLS